MQDRIRLSSWGAAVAGEGVVEVISLQYEAKYDMAGQIPTREHIIKMHTNNEHF